jgi:stage III sporulation protein AF
MEWLNGWIKELILIILIAAFTDLLLPNHALQRYVRTVIGLFILLVLLSPIYELFHQRWTPNQVIQAGLGEPTANEAQMQSLSTIVKQSNELKSANQQQAKQLLEQQLAVSMQEGIENQFDVSVQQMQVTTKLDDKGKPSIDQVNLVLSASSNKTVKVQGQVQEEISTIAVIKPIQPVIIDLKSAKDERDVPIESTNVEKSMTKSESADDSIHEQIKQSIALEWQIKRSQIHIK